MSVVWGWNKIIVYQFCQKFILAKVFFIGLGILLFFGLGFLFPPAFAGLDVFQNSSLCARILQRREEVTFPA